MFEPILQLQRLRTRFLLIREVCLRSTGHGARVAHFRDAALLAWRASRLIGGWLNGHPNSQFHAHDTLFARLSLRMRAAALEVLYANVGRRTLWLHEQLESVARACADIRAVTSSVAVNDILGRREPEIAALRRATAAAAAIAAPPPRQAVTARAGGGDAAWPFMSL